MKGDFSRDSFNETRPYTRVLRVQGGADLDSDWNEQVSILVDSHRRLARNLIGWHGTFDDGFRVEENDAGKVRVTRGSYYVDGMLCLNSNDNYEVTIEPPPAVGSMHLIYLEAWERFVAAAEADDIREVALNGVETSDRARIEWRIRSLPLSDGQFIDSRATFHALLADCAPSWKPLPQLKAMVESPIEDTSSNPCAALPGSGYVGLENQLYRVEVHQADAAGISFKWSRDNASVVYSIAKLELDPRDVDGKKKLLVKAALSTPNGNRGVPLVVGNWVELLCDEVSPGDHPAPMLRVANVSDDWIRFEAIDKPPEGSFFQSGKHAFLRRWDHDPKRSEGTILLPAGVQTDKDLSFDLENGIRVTLKPTLEHCVAGDYWLIPARTGPQDIIWPRSNGDYEFVGARRLQRGYAPLAFVAPFKDGPDRVKLSFPRIFRRGLAELPPADAAMTTDEIVRQVKKLVTPSSLKTLATTLKPLLPVYPTLKAAVFLQPEDLTSAEPAKLNVKLKNLPQAVIELESWNERMWLELLKDVIDDSVAATKAKQAKEALQVLWDAQTLCTLFRAWPTRTLTEDDLKKLSSD